MFKFYFLTYVADVVASFTLNYQLIQTLDDLDDDDDDPEEQEENSQEEFPNS
jgi:hypothetical protein